jgi:hypothetical protein
MAVRPLRSNKKLNWNHKRSNIWSRAIVPATLESPFIKFIIVRVFIFGIRSFNMLHTILNDLCQDRANCIHNRNSSVVSTIILFVLTTLELLLRMQLTPFWQRLLSIVRSMLGLQVPKINSLMMMNLTNGWMFQCHRHNCPWSCAWTSAF